jgi:methylglutaconyl-CoA hydratase
MPDEPSHDCVAYAVAGPAATVTLNRPDKRNALHEDMLEAVDARLRQANDDPTVRVIALAGAGKDFCAGADLSALEKIAKNGSLENLADAEGLMRLLLRMRALPKPIVAVVRGRALAGGCGLASGCDLIVATESAQFGYPEVKIGFIPAMVMAILRRQISEKRAFEWMAFGEPISARQAQEWGFVNQVFPDAEFDARSADYIAALASRSASALRLMKRLLYHMDGLTFERALQSGADLNALCRATEDCQAGVARFLRKD